MSLHIEANTPAMLGDLKVTNRRTVLSAFRRGAVAGVSEVSQQTGISRPTVVKCIRFFLDSGLLVSLGKGPSTAIGGKRPENYTLSGSRYFLCLALWPQEMRACLYTIGHTLLGSISLSGPLPDTADEISRKSATLAARLLREVTARILSRGEKAFLHSYTDNATAIRLYESLGYRGRRELTFTSLTGA